MFPWNRTQRQVLATIVLVCGSIVPTLGIGLFIWTVTRPGHTRDVEVDLGRMLDTRVAIESVRHPRPNEDLLTGVTLRPGQGDVDRGAVRVRRLRASHEGDVLTIQAERVEWGSDSVGESIDQLDEWCERLSKRWKRLSLISEQAAIALRQGEPAVKLRDLALVAEASRVSASFRTSGRAGPGRHELSLEREGGHRRVALKTREGRLPIAALGALTDAGAWFGVEAEVEGEFVFQKRAGADDWTMAFTGTVFDVDLNQMVGRRFAGNDLRGRATLEVARALWGPLPDGQSLGWQEVEGQLRATKGAIAPATMRSMASCLKFRLEGTPSSDELVSFDALGLGFHLTSDGQLRLFGRVESLASMDAVLLCEGTGAAMMRAPVGVSDVRGLWKLLFPVGEDTLVPATQDSHVMRHLPLPGPMRTAHRGVQGN